MTIYARLGNESGYEVVRGARVECGDGENYAGVPILGWDCDIETVRAFAREHVAQDIDWSACWDSALPSRAGCVEAPLVCSLERAEQIVAQINAAATR